MAQVLAMINLMIAMQGRVRDWVNYHSQHHRLPTSRADRTIRRSKRWAWVGWILFRDKRGHRARLAALAEETPDHHLDGPFL